MPRFSGASFETIAYVQILTENTYKALDEHDDAKFLAEGQPRIGRKGHLVAVFKHRSDRDSSLL